MVPSKIPRTVFDGGNPPNLLFFRNFGLVGGFVFSQKKHKNKTVQDAGQSEIMKSLLPRKAVGNRGSKTAKRLTHIKPCHVNPDSERAGWSPVVISNE